MRPAQVAVQAGSPSLRRLLADLAPEEALRALELVIVRRLEGYLRGEHIGLLPGPGSELAEARPYQPGVDDVRHMDWAVTARTTQPHVREVIADRELETWTLVDLSASMHFGTSVRAGRGFDKRHLAAAAVATVGTLTGSLGDRFGGYLVGSATHREHPARHGRLALAALVRAILDDPAPSATSSDNASGVTSGSDPGAAPDLAGAIEAFAARHRRRGLRVVVSDFLSAEGTRQEVAGRSSSRWARRWGWTRGEAPVPSAGEPGWGRAMRRLGTRHQVLAVEVLDPRDLTLPDVGVVTLVDPETGRTMEVDTSRAATRAAFDAAASAHREQVRTELRRAGAAHLVLRTDRDWVSDTARFLLTHRIQARRLHSGAGFAG